MQDRKLIFIPINNNSSDNSRGGSHWYAHVHVYQMVPGYIQHCEVWSWGSFCNDPPYGIILDHSVLFGILWDYFASFIIIDRLWLFQIILDSLWIIPDHFELLGTISDYSRFLSDHLRIFWIILEPLWIISGSFWIILGSSLGYSLGPLGPKDVIKIIIFIILSMMI